jgi:DNA-directed RNA polymerase beta' subunit
MAKKKEINDINRRIKIREDRLSRLKQLSAPDAIIENETKMINELKEKLINLTKIA